MNPESKSQEDAIDFNRAMSFPETNLYAYVSNNPLMLIDVFGLSEEIGGMRNMFEARGRDGTDAWEASDRGARTVDILEITSALAGITHGAVDFTVDYLQDLQIAAAYMGSEDIGTCEEKIQMIADIQYAQACQAVALDHMLMGLMLVEETDAVYPGIPIRNGDRSGSSVVGCWRVWGCKGGC
jgi:hypothetical protein